MIIFRTVSFQLSGLTATTTFQIIFIYHRQSQFWSLGASLWTASLRTAENTPRISRKRIPILTLGHVLTLAKGSPYTLLLSNKIFITTTQAKELTEGPCRVIVGSQWSDLLGKTEVKLENLTYSRGSTKLLHLLS